MTRDTEQITRRRVLKSGAAASVAATGLAGVAAAKGRGNGRGGGGHGYIVQTGDQRDAQTLNGTFTILSEVDNDDWNPTEISPSCNGNSRPLEYTPYDTDSPHWIFFPKDRNVNLGNEYEVVTYTKDCTETQDPEPREWIRVVVKPA